MTVGTTTLPLPSWEDSTVVVEPPGTEPGAWSGAPSSIVADGHVYLAYRLRLPIGAGRGIANVVARSSDGLNFTVVAEIGKDTFGAESLERPALVRTPEGRWRLYVSAATPETKHWRVDLLEADTPEGLATAAAVTVLAGDETAAWKDPVLHHDEHGWHLWASVHPLESWDDADRMTTEYATSPDGVHWTRRRTALAGRPGRWDARGVRVSSVQVTGDEITVAYDGRATAGRTGRSAPGWPAARACRTGRSASSPRRSTSRSGARTRRTGCAT